EMSENRLPRCTIEQLLSWHPCAEWPHALIRQHARGRETFHARDLLPLRTAPPHHRLRVVLRDDLIPAAILHEFACWCAEQVLPLYEAQYPGDARPRDAIAAKRAWLRGEITDEQLSAARDAAWDAARDAARAAARDAAWDAARAAARDAARAAA